MKTIFGFILLFTFASPVLADIPAPPRFDGTEMVITGPAAVELNQTLKGKILPGDSLRTRNSSFNVLQSKDRKFLIYCERVRSLEQDGTSSLYIECIIQKSAKPLPVFNPPRRMG